MLRETDERFHIISQCPIKVFAAGNMDRYWYPYRLQTCEYAKPSVRRQSLEYMIDCAINNEEITNEDVLDAAIEHNATYVIPKDYFGEMDKTTDSVLEFLDEHKRRECTATPIIPLQPPHADHYDDLPGYGMYALGGLNQLSSEEIIQYLHEFDDKVPSSVYRHGFGFGTTLKLIQELAHNPHLLDSLDVSSHELQVRCGKITDRRWHSRQFLYPTGTDTTTIRSMYAVDVLLKLNYMLGPLCNDEVLDADPSDFTHFNKK